MLFCVVKGYHGNNCSCYPTEKKIYDYGKIILKHWRANNCVRYYL